ncbi:MAG: GlmU family protein [Salibacteraceae bacterium]
MNIILFDGKSRQKLLPLTYTRPVGNLRIGILTINEKWEKCLNAVVSYETESYLTKKFPRKITSNNFLINGGLCPDGKVESAISSLKQGEMLVKDEVILAAHILEGDLLTLTDFNSFVPLNKIQYSEEVLIVEHPWDIFSKNAEALELDFNAITKDRISQPISESNTIIGDRIFLEKGAKVEASILNSNSGAIYIGKDAEIMEGSMVRGGLALCDHAGLKMGAKIYGATTIGPHSKAGGEISNSVIYGFSNKGHDGFIGNTVIGEWCNLGADTNTSNLKNNYAKVKLWSYETGRFFNTELQFCGLIMGDHSKSGINTMFNTGTVVGVSANIYGGGFPRNFIPSFAWGGAAGMMEFRYNKAAEVADAMMSRRGLSYDEMEQGIIKEVYEMTAIYRKNLK